MIIIWQKLIFSVTLVQAYTHNKNYEGVMHQTICALLNKTLAIMK